MAAPLTAADVGVRDPPAQADAIDLQAGTEPRPPRHPRTPPSVHALAPRVFLVLAGVAGTLFVLLIPPGQGLDEGNHMYRAWQVASGQMTATVVHDPAFPNALRAGGGLPDCLVSYFVHFGVVAGSGKPYQPAEYFSEPAPCDGRTRLAYFENASLYPPVDYLPAVVGIDTGRLLAHVPGVGHSVWLPFYLARLTGLLFYIGVIYLALRVAPRGRLLILLVACLPIALQEAATVNEDGRNIAVAILLIAAALRLIDDDEPRGSVVGLAAGSAIALGLLKPSGILFALLPLVAPALWRRGNRRLLGLLGGAVMVDVAGAVIWHRVTAGIDLSGDWPWTSVGRQEDFVRAHPLHFLRVLWDTLVSNDFGIFSLRTTVEQFGMFRAGTHDPAAPNTVTVAAFAVIGAALLSDWGPLRRPLSWRRAGLAAGAAAVIISSFVLLYLGIYIVGAEVGGNVEAPMQGRVFVPLLACLPVPFALLVRRREPSPRAWAGVGVMAFVLMSAFARVPGIFY